jgi:hypothetical protein
VSQPTSEVRRALTYACLNSIIPCTVVKHPNERRFLRAEVEEVELALEALFSCPPEEKAAYVIDRKTKIWTLEEVRV